MYYIKTHPIYNVKLQFLIAFERRLMKRMAAFEECNRYISFIKNQNSLGIKLGYEAYNLLKKAMLTPTIEEKRLMILPLENLIFSLMFSNYFMRIFKEKRLLYWDNNYQEKTDTILDYKYEFTLWGLM
jgi:hypothetical protein